MGRVKFPCMPPLTYARRDAAAACKEKRAPSLVPLQHSVITFGSHHNAPHLVPFNAVVEGNRTGEVRLAHSGEQRRSRDEGVEAEQNKIRQLSAELQRALDKLRVKNNEEQKLRRRAAVAQLQLAEEVERRTSTVHGILQLMKLQGDFMRGTNAEVCRLLQVAGEERDAAVRSLSDERASRVGEGKAQEKLNSLQIENDGLRQQLEEAWRAKTGLENDYKRLQGEKEKDEVNFSKLRQQLELDLMRTQAQLQGVNRELAEAKNTMTTSDTQLQQVQLFIQMVCQPDFYVVKDRSLEPVDKNRRDPTGFVLVPLAVLLQGYTLLAPSCRQDLIESYRARLP
ncbi:uncharacterized protein Tco025E_07073 [Trypanosoma conorhini]|uniref:Uncharacterized protein n=1 Tax=Trypanosoma conorhini TaxID=83891 RepID=A0A422NTT7_9TRYP|nr:uncharacterized protein Tco025E_07073 [Trypanosoma conorhini]RNF08872.1 hypothetical protein Tco025E_07073 [Trypanosoma conorhini]